jgi:hypothetical protein
VLGLREIMDAPHLLDAEWKKNGIMQKIDQYYDSIWVYGPPDFYDPAHRPRCASQRSPQDGLRRFPAAQRVDQQHLDQCPQRQLYPRDHGRRRRWFGSRSRRHERLRTGPDAAAEGAVVLGPYMPAAERTTLVQKGTKIPYIKVIEFDNNMEELIAGAAGVVAMGGYNTYCEILSFDKPALIVPRVKPREEQLLRAQRASELGLVEMLLPDASADAASWLTALKRLPHRQPPSKSGSSMRLEGLNHISELSAAGSTTVAVTCRSSAPSERSDPLPHRRKLLVVLKGYPSLSETFIAQELLGLEKAGFDLTLISMRRPTDKKRHPVHDEIKARVVYLPEYLHEEPLRVLKGLISPAFRQAGVRRASGPLFQGSAARHLAQSLPPAWPGNGAWHEWPDNGSGCMRTSSTRRRPSPNTPAC